MCAIAASSESTTRMASSSPPNSRSQSAVCVIPQCDAPTACTTPVCTLIACGSPVQSSVGPTPPLVPTAAGGSDESPSSLASSDCTIPPGALIACGSPVQSSV